MLFHSAARSTFAEGRKREILEAALRVIAAGGADAVTHRRVADEAGVALGSLTYYFESREEMIRDAFRFYIAEATAFLLEVERDVPPATPDGLVDMILDLTRREFATPDMVRAEYAMILHAARDEQVARAFASWERSLEMRLAAPLEAMGMPRPLYTARTIVHLVRGFELEQIAGRIEDPRDLRNRLLTVVNALVPKDKPARTPHARPKRQTLAKRQATTRSPK